jgi:pseudaminic acid synthase
MFKIGNYEIGEQCPVFIIAELSCNHNQNYNIAVELIKEAYKAGANAIKLQTYTPDTITLNCNNKYFKIEDTIWKGKTLHELYSEAFTPWEWHKGLQELTHSLGMEFFTSPFDTTAIDFLETLNISAYKIASFEITDHILIKKIAKTGKPVIISSGMASFNELCEAIKLLKNNGCNNIALLKCTSAYPSLPEDANLITIQHNKNSFNVVCGLSDHTLGIEVPIASVALGAKIIEKHFTLSRDSGSADDAFSLIPSEFKQMVDSVRIVEKSLGTVKYCVPNEEKCKVYRRSLFVVKDILKGEKITEDNIKSIRPGYGLHTKYYDTVLGMQAIKNLEFGTPLQLEDLY